MLTRYRFLADTYATERLKTLSVWSQWGDGELDLRLHPKLRTPREHMVHQCVSEDVWMRTMLGIESGLPLLPAREEKLELLRHYASASESRLAFLLEKEDAWFEAETQFFDVRRSRAWVMTRRIAHSAHHRGQLTVHLRALGRELYSVYGPTADTGGLFQNRARVVYRYADVPALLEAESAGGSCPPLPGPGEKPCTERPGSDSK